MTHTKATAPARLSPTARAPATGRPLTRLQRIRVWAASALRDLVYDGAVALWDHVGRSPARGMAAPRAHPGRLSPSGRSRLRGAPQDRQLGSADVEGPGLARADLDRRHGAGVRGDHACGIRPRVPVDAGLVLGGLGSHDQYALTNLGVATVDTFGEAVALAAIGVVLAPAALLLSRGCAAMHAGLAARTLTSSTRAEEGTDEA